jgi:hypothetical protein
MMMIMEEAEVGYPCPFYLSRGKSSTMNMKHRYWINEKDDAEKEDCFVKKRRWKTRQKMAHHCSKVMLGV